MPDFKVEVRYESSKPDVTDYTEDYRDLPDGISARDRAIEESSGEHVEVIAVKEFMPNQGLWIDINDTIYEDVVTNELSFNTGAPEL